MTQHEDDCQSLERLVLAPDKFHVVVGTAFIHVTPVDLDAPADPSEAPDAPPEPTPEECE